MKFLKLNYLFQYFKDFIEQEIEAYDDVQMGEQDADDGVTPRKQIREVSRPGVEKIGEAYFYISGPDQVFLLNADPSLNGYARKLASTEILSLPEEEIVYSGNPEVFEVDERKAFELLSSVIFKMNEMQEPTFHSFPLATFLAHLMGFLYTQIMDELDNYYTCIVVSGSGNTSRTGKSLMTSMWQIVFDGFKTKERVLSISEAAIYEKLDKGISVYSKSISF